MPSTPLWLADTETGDTSQWTGPPIYPGGDIETAGGGTLVVTSSLRHSGVDALLSTVGPGLSSARARRWLEPRGYRTFDVETWFYLANDPRLTANGPTDGDRYLALMDFWSRDLRGDDDVIWSLRLTDTFNSGTGTSRPFFALVWNPGNKGIQGPFVSSAAPSSQAMPSLLTGSGGGGGGGTVSVPSAPTNVQTVGGDTTATVTWSPPTNDGTGPSTGSGGSPPVGTWFKARVSVVQSSHDFAGNPRFDGSIDVYIDFGDGHGEVHAFSVAAVRTGYPDAIYNAWRTNCEVTAGLATDGLTAACSCAVDDAVISINDPTPLTPVLPTTGILPQTPGHIAASQEQNDLVNNWKHPDGTRTLLPGDFVPAARVGEPGGVCPLDENGLIPAVLLGAGASGLHDGLNVLADQSPGVYLVTPGAANHLYFGSYPGTHTTPQSVPSGWLLGALGFGGAIDGAGTMRWASALEGWSSENWSAAGQGTELWVKTIPPGQAFSRRVAGFHSTGNLEQMYPPILDVASQDVAPGGTPTAISVTAPVMHISASTAVTLPNPPVDSSTLPIFAVFTLVNSGTTAITLPHGLLGTPGGADLVLQPSESGTWQWSALLGGFTCLGVVAVTARPPTVQQASTSVSLVPNSPSIYVFTPDANAVLLANPNIQTTGVTAGQTLVVLNEGPGALIFTASNAVSLGPATSFRLESGQSCMFQAWVAFGAQWSLVVGAGGSGSGGTTTTIASSWETQKLLGLRAALANWQNAPAKIAIIADSLGEGSTAFDQFSADLMARYPGTDPAPFHLYGGFNCDNLLMPWAINGIQSTSGGPDGNTFAGGDAHTVSSVSAGFIPSCLGAVITDSQGHIPPGTVITAVGGPSTVSISNAATGSPSTTDIFTWSNLHSGGGASGRFAVLNAGDVLTTIGIPPVFPRDEYGDRYRIHYMPNAGHFDVAVDGVTIATDISTVAGARDLTKVVATDTSVPSLQWTIHGVSAPLNYGIFGGVNLNTFTGTQPLELAYVSNFPTAGTINININGADYQLTYNGKNDTGSVHELLNVRMLNPTSVVATSQAFAVLRRRTTLTGSFPLNTLTGTQALNVGSTSGWPVTGGFKIVVNGTDYFFSFTGITATQLQNVAMLNPVAVTAPDQAPVQYVTFSDDMAGSVIEHANLQSGTRIVSVTDVDTAIIDLKPTGNGSSSATIHRNSWTSPDLGHGNHVITVTGRSGSSQIDGIYHYNGNYQAGVQVHLLSHAGYKTGDMLQLNGVAANPATTNVLTVSTDQLQYLQDEGFHCVIFATGTNDAAIANYQAWMQPLVSVVRLALANSSGVIWVPEPKTGADHAWMSGIPLAAQTIAAATGSVVVDMNLVVPDHSAQVGPDQPYQITADGVHYSQAGAKIASQLLLDTLDGLPRNDHTFSYFNPPHWPGYAAPFFDPPSGSLGYSVFPAPSGNPGVFMGNYAFSTGIFAGDTSLSKLSPDCFLFRAGASQWNAFGTQILNVPNLLDLGVSPITNYNLNVNAAYGGVLRFNYYLGTPQTNNPNTFDFSTFGGPLATFVNVQVPPLAVQSGKPLGKVSFSGWDGSQLYGAAWMQVLTDELFSHSPLRGGSHFEFWVTPTGSQSPFNVLTLNGSGPNNVQITGTVLSVGAFSIFGGLLASTVTSSGVLAGTNLSVNQPTLGTPVTTVTSTTNVGGTDSPTETTYQFRGTFATAGAQASSTLASITIPTNKVMMVVAHFVGRRTDGANAGQGAWFTKEWAVKNTNGVVNGIINVASVAGATDLANVSTNLILSPTSTPTAVGFQVTQPASCTYVWHVHVRVYPVGT